VLIPIAGGKGDDYEIIRGTYAHPLLIPHIASWVSLQFGHMVSTILQDIAVSTFKEYKEKYESVMLDQIKIVGERDAVMQTNEMLEAEVKVLEATNNMLNAEKEALAAAQTILEHDKVKLAQEKDLAQCENAKLGDEVNKKKKALDIWAKMHAFTLIRTNTPNKLPYYVIRCLKGRMSNRIKRLRLKHPAMILPYQKCNIANGVNLFKRLKATGKIKSRGNYFMTALSEIDLISLVGKLAHTAA
jgi:hypothetical protein